MYSFNSVLPLLLANTIFDLADSMSPTKEILWRLYGAFFDKRLFPEKKNDEIIGRISLINAIYEDMISICICKFARVLRDIIELKINEIFHFSFLVSK